MKRALFSGLVIRWCAGLTVFTTFVAPRWIGTAEFGVAATVMAIPCLVQGFCEPVVMTLAIAQLGASDGRCKLARVRNDVTGAAVLGAMAAFLFALWYVPPDSTFNPAACGALAAAFLALATWNTWLIGLGYALKEHRVLMQTYVASGIAQPVMLWLLRGYGSGAFLLSLIVSQLAVLAVLWSSQNLRREFRSLLAAVPAGSRSDYIAAVAPRISVLLLNTGTVLLAGILYSPARVAGFRLSIGVAGALNFLVPISPQILQSTLTSADASGRRSARIVLTISFAIMCGLCGGLFLWSDELLARLLQERSFSPMDGAIFLAMPFFLLIQPLSSYLYSTGRARITLWATLGCLTAFAVGTIFLDPRLAFAGGAIVQIAVSLALLARGTATVNICGAVGRPAIEAQSRSSRSYELVRSGARLEPSPPPQ